MNACPTRRPTTTSSSQYERDAASSRSSFASSQRAIPRALREGKKDLLEPRVALKTRARAQLGHRPFADDTPAAEQDQTIADSLRVRQLMDREKERPSERRELAERTHHFARLAEIESVERLIEHEQRLGREKSDGEHHAPMFSLRQLADAR